MKGWYETQDRTFAYLDEIRQGKREWRRITYSPRVLRMVTFRDLYLKEETISERWRSFTSPPKCYPEPDGVVMGPFNITFFFFWIKKSENAVSESDELIELPLVRWIDSQVSGPIPDFWPAKKSFSPTSTYSGSNRAPAWTTSYEPRCDYFNILTLCTIFMTAWVISGPMPSPVATVIGTLCKKFVKNAISRS